MTRFIHTADWHIGNGFSGFQRDKAERLRAARIDAVERIFAFAAGESIGLVLCAGDQLDSAGPEAREDLLKVFGRIRRYPSVTAVMIAGNHDPEGPGSPWDSIDRAAVPENVIIVHGRRILELPQFGLTLVAASLNRKYGRENPLAWYAGTQAQPGRVTVGLVHGSLAIQGRHSADDFPVPTDFPEKAGLDYLALGHWHSRYSSSPRVGYPGTPEPLTYGDEGGVLLVSVESPGLLPEVRTVQTAGFKWVQVRIAIDAAVASAADPVVVIRQRLDSLAMPDASGSRGEKGGHGPNAAVVPGTGGESLRPGPSHAQELLVQLTVEGRIGAGRATAIRDLLSSYADRFFHLQVEDRIQILPTPEELATMGAEGYMAAVVDELLGLRDKDPDRAAVVDAALLRVYDFFATEDNRMSESGFVPTPGSGTAESGELP